MAIRNLRWELETTFTRKQVLAMARVAEYVGNVQSDLSKGFPSTFKDFDWESFREAMALFAELGRQDMLAYRSLCQTVVDVHAGKVKLYCGKVMEVEGSESPGGS